MGIGSHRGGRQGWLIGVVSGGQGWCSGVEIRSGGQGWWSEVEVRNGRQRWLIGGVAKWSGVRGKERC